MNKGKMISVELYLEQRKQMKEFLGIVSNSIPVLDIDNNRWIKQLIEVPNGYRMVLEKEK